MEDLGQSFQLNIGDKAGTALQSLDGVFIQVYAFPLQHFCKFPLGRFFW